MFGATRLPSGGLVRRLLRPRGNRPAGDKEVITMEAATAEPLRKQYRILVIEGDAIARQTIQDTLRKAGYVVVDAADSEQAALLLGSDRRRDRINVIICDLRAAKIKGIEASAYFHVRYPSIPVIVTATYQDIEWAIALMKRGATDYLLKPVSRDDLLLVVRGAVHRHLMVSRGSF